MHRRVLISLVFSALPSEILLKLEGGERGLKLHLPAPPGSPCAFSPVCKCVRALLCHQHLSQLPSSILLWLLSRWDKQKLAAAQVNGALELWLEASMLHLNTIAWLRTLT